MINSEKILIIIPARAGSKGLVSKNKAIFSNSPLIVHTINLSKALQKEFNVDIMVTSDDSDIIRIVNNLGVDTEYNRPNRLSGDTISMNETLNHAISWFHEKKEFDWLLLLQTTSPLRTYSGIVNFINKVSCDGHHDKHCFATISPTKMKKYELIQFDNGQYRALSDRGSNAHRQSAEDQNIFFEDGAAYMASADFWKANGNMVVGPKMKYVLTHENPIIDIDDIEDFKVAEFLFFSRNK